MNAASVQCFENPVCDPVGVASAHLRLEQFVPTFMAEASALHMAKPNLFLAVSESERPEIISLHLGISTNRPVPNRLTAIPPINF
jgi:hypothetical protein